MPAYVSGPSNYIPFSLTNPPSCLFSLPMTQANRTRSRDGCLPCRYHKRKCDGAQPRCRNCNAADQQCRWGVKVTFHPSRELRLSSEDNAALLALEEERGSRQTIRFVDNTAQIVREYEPTSNIVDNEDQIEYGFEGPVQTEVTDPTPDATSSQPSIVEYNHSNLSFKDASGSRTRLLPGSAPFVPTSLGFGNGLPASEVEQVQLMRIYLQEPGLWCEITDSGRHFTVSYVHKLMANKPFAAAAMALASRQLDAVRRCPRESTLGLYQHAVQSLLHYEPSQCGKATLACCVLLSMYEMMTSGVSEWRRHLKVSLS